MRTHHIYILYSYCMHIVPCIYYPTYTGIPDTLHEYLNNNHNRNLKYVALGPAGQYYVESIDGKAQLSETCSDSFIEDKLKKPVSVVLVAFGPVGCHYIKFTDGTSVWKGKLY